MPLSLLLAASPVDAGSLRPMSPVLLPQAAPVLVDGGLVETFDPVGRAELIAAQIPRLWSGSYRPFDGSPAQTVELQLETVRPMGQMVVLTGQMRLGPLATPVQGNINAKSDQLDLLLLADELGAGLEPGGEFLGLQILSLSGWAPPRLTSPGGRLQLVPRGLSPGGTTAGGTIRGLW